MVRYDLLKGIKNGFVLLAAIFCLLSPAHAQEEITSDQLWIWDDFSGGLDVKTANIKLDKKSGDICENIRFNEDRTSLVKRDDILSYGTADTTEQITGMHRLYLSDGTKLLIVSHGDEIETGADATGAFTAVLDVASGGYRWQFLTWHDLAIGMDGRNQPIKYDGSSASATYLGSCLATDKTSGTGGPDGTYTYKVTFYSTTYEIGFNQASNSLTVTDNTITLTEIPIAPTTYLGEDVTGRKVYRTLTGGSTYKLLTNGTIADNTTVTIDDTTADGSLGTTLSTDLDEAPPKGRLCIIHQDRIFIANNPTYPSRIYFSDTGNHDYFPADNYYNIRKNDGDSITLLEEFHGLLTVGKENSLQKVYTNVDDVSWEIGDPVNFKGCQAMYTAASSVHGTIYLARDGIYVFDGQYSRLLSDKITPIINDISEVNFDNCWAIVHDNKYYLAYTSEESGAKENNRVLVYEIPTKTFTVDIMEINSFCVFNSGTDWGILYLGSSATGAVYSSSIAGHVIIKKRHSDFDDGTFDDMRYIPTGVPGGEINDPILEIARIETIDSLSGNIDDLTGDIDREDTDGTFSSESIQTNMAALNKVYWNEIIPATGGDVTVAIRTDADDASWGSWSSEYTDPTGSDISALTAREYLQYRITLTATDIDYSPTVYRNENFVVKITYTTEGSSSESSVPLRWRSGWTDLGAPGRIKMLRRIEVYHEGTSGDLTLTFENYDEETDEFIIDLADTPDYYEEVFADGGFSAKFIRLLIENDDLNSLVLDKVILVYDVYPIE